MNDNIEQFLIGLGFTEKSIEILQDELTPELAKELGEQLKQYSNIDVNWEWAIVDPENDVDEPACVWFNYDVEPVKMIGNKTENDYGLESYDDSIPKPDFIVIKKIIVEDERDKDQLLKASQYFHDQFTTNTDFIAVNTIAHLYMSPELIEIYEPEMILMSASTKTLNRPY